MAPSSLEPFANIFSNFDFKNEVIVNKFEGVRFRQNLDFGFPNPQRGEEPQPPLVGFGVCHQLGLVKLIHFTKMTPPYNFRRKDFGSTILYPGSRFSISRPFPPGRTEFLVTSMGKPLYNLL